MISFYWPWSFYTTVQVNTGPIPHSTESPSTTPCKHPGALYPLAPLSPRAAALPSPEMAGLGIHASHSPRLSLPRYLGDDARGSRHVVALPQNSLTCERFSSEETPQTWTNAIRRASSGLTTADMARTSETTTSQATVTVMVVPALLHPLSGSTGLTRETPRTTVRLLRQRVQVILVSRARTPTSPAPAGTKSPQSRRSCKLTILDQYTICLPYTSVVLIALFPCFCLAFCIQSLSPRACQAVARARAGT